MNLKNTKTLICVICCVSHSGLMAQTEKSVVCGIVMDLFGNPIAGASVVSEGSDNKVKANENGEYCLQSKVPGSTLMSASAPGFASQAMTIALLANKTVTLDFALTVGHLVDLPKKVLSGVVLNEYGSPLPNSRISARSCFSSGIGAQTSSDKDGRFTITLPEPGQYCCVAWHPGYFADTDVIVVPAATKSWVSTRRFTLRHSSTRTR